jgi:butyrate kinase
MSQDAPAILVINPGSTSTKIALFRGAKAVFEDEVPHTRKELDRFGEVMGQGDFRLKKVASALAKRGIEIEEIDGFIGRGGLLRPVPSGVFKVNRKMLTELRNCTHGEHASNLGAIIADGLARQVGKAAYIADPVVVDELDDVARISGHPSAPRRSVFHALGQKAVARKVAAKLGKPYERLNLIVAFLGGGGTVGAHCKGKVVDVTNGLEGEGAFTPERTGTLPLLPFVKYILDNKLNYNEVARIVTREGGALALLGTNDLRYIERKVAAGSKKFALVRNAFIYQIAKDIGAMATVTVGKVDAIAITGGVANNKALVRDLAKRVRFIAPVHVILKNSEMEALALAAAGVLTGSQRARAY